MFKLNVKEKHENVIFRMSRKLPNGEILRAKPGHPFPIKKDDEKE